MGATQGCRLQAQQQQLHPQIVSVFCQVPVSSKEMVLSLLIPLERRRASLAPCSSAEPARAS